MKKEEILNETVNVVADAETLAAIVEDNMSIVPKNQLKKFEKLSLKEKAAKIQFYQDVQRMKEDARIKNSVPNRVKELFEKRHGTIEDAKSVLKFCTEFIDGFKQREIEKIDEEIARLEEMKRSL
jgi:hypothetical protein